MNTSKKKLAVAAMTGLLAMGGLSACETTHNGPNGNHCNWASQSHHNSCKGSGWGGDHHDRCHKKCNSCNSCKSNACS